MLTTRFFYAWAAAVLVIGIVRFIYAWMYSQRTGAATVQLVAVAVISCFIWLLGRSIARVDFRRIPLGFWIVGLAIFLLAFVGTALVIRVVFLR